MYKRQGVYFTIRTKGVQIRFIKDMFKQLTEKKNVQGCLLYTSPEYTTARDRSIPGRFASRYLLARSALSTR